MTNILWDSYRDDDDLACELTPPPQPNLGLVKSYRDVCLDGRPLRLPGEGVESRGDVNGDFLRSGLVQESNRARVGFPDNSPDSRSEEGTIPSLHLSRGLRPGVLHQLPGANAKA